MVKARLIVFVLSIIMLVIVLLPFHAFLTVWAGSSFGHYTAFRLWKEDLVFVIGLVVIGLMIADHKMAKEILTTKLSWAIGAYVVLDLAVAAVAHFNHSVSNKALAYGLLDDLRFLAFFIICWAAAIYSKRLNNVWYKLILWPALIVIGFGLLQMFVLPANFLSHYGYGPKTIMPYQTINNNPHYIRILSTLRGADPLGTYLILPISVLAVLLIRYPKSWTWAKLLVLVGAIIVLFGSYSRGAWIGAVLACLFMAASYINFNSLARYKLPIVIGLIILFGLAIGGGLAFRHSHTFENIFFHTQTNSAAPVSSDQAHLTAIEGGLKRVFHHLFGSGPGSSGPGSVYNHDRPARIPENYFLEVGEESGWLGLVLFVIINALVAVKLWQRRDSAFALSLLAALVGITVVNMLTLAWTDDTLSYIWWGLAGLAMVTPIVKNDSKLKAKSLK